MFRVVLPPIIRSENNCIYSIWLLSHRYCYLPLQRQVAVAVWHMETGLYIIITGTIPKPVFTQIWLRPVITCVCTPEATNTFGAPELWAVCPSKHIEPSTNGGIINSITMLHRVGYFSWVILSNWATSVITAERADKQKNLVPYNKMKF
jgi:hypothetical protein